MRFRLENGFATVSSSIVALPEPGAGRLPVFRFAPRLPTAQPWKTLKL